MVNGWRVDFGLMDLLASTFFYEKLDYITGGAGMSQSASSILVAGRGTFFSNSLHSPFRDKTLVEKLFALHHSVMVENLITEAYSVFVAIRTFSGQEN